MVTLRHFVEVEKMLLKDLFKGVKASQFYFYIITCVLLFLGYFAPINNEIFKLSKENFDWSQIFTSSFIHANFEHFYSNLILFTVVYFLIVLITNNRKDLWKQFTKYYVPIILVVSVLNYIGFIMNPLFKNTCGFSDIVTALIGVLIFFTIEVLNKDLNLRINYQNTKTTLFFTLYLAATTTVTLVDYIIITSGMSNQLTQYSWIITTIIINGLAINYIKDKIKINQIKKYLHKSSKPIILTVIIILIIGLPQLSAISIQQGNIVNGLAHFIGLYTGFFIMYFTQTKY